MDLVRPVCHHDPVGRRLGRYELLVPVGAGGMAVVWAARLHGTHGFAKKVAVKVMLPVLAADPRFTEMFLGEARLASGVVHPNVCAVLDLGEHEGLPYLAMEWIDGDSLATLGRVPHDIASRIALDAARGLHAAHDATDESGAALGIVHRDVSPQNLLVNAEGSVKVADFGVAKATARGTQTKSGYVKGKVQYLAPEQVYSEDVDRRTDVFALGIVLYEAITGVHPFAAATDVATLARIANAEPARPIPELDPDCPADLAAIVARALAKDSGARYASMAELADDLEARGGPCTAAALATFVKERIGEKLAERRAAIAGAASGMAPANGVPERTEPATPAAWTKPDARTRTSWLALVAAMAVGGAIALVARASATAPAAPPSVAAPAKTVVPEPVVTTPSPLVPPSVASASPVPTSTAVPATRAHPAPAVTPSTSASTKRRDVLETRE
jgi:serine/threonine-protein kinase